MSKQLNELQDFRRPDDWQSELDRLRASNAALLKAVNAALGYLNCPTAWNTDVLDDMFRAAIAQAEKEKQP